MSSAFTISYSASSNQLRSPVVIKPYGDNGSYSDRVAVWDTGAMKTTISTELAKELSLSIISYVHVSTPNGKSLVPCYYVDVSLPNGVTVVKVFVLGGVLAGFDVLVGMDIINLGDFAVTNFNGKTVFSYRVPSLSTIDFVPKMS